MNDERAPTLQSEEQFDAKRESGNSPKDTLSGHEETKEPKVQNHRELDDARYAALMSHAHSDQARALVVTVTDMVAAHELAAGTRTNKRQKGQTALSSAVERFLADLLLAQTSEKTNGYVYRSMRTKIFTECDVSYRVFKALVDALVNLGLLEQHKGFQAWSELFGARAPFRQRATRFRATPKLLDICNQHGVHTADFHQHFLIPLPDDPLKLHSASRRNEYGRKIPGRPMRFEPTIKTKTLEEQLKQLNTFFDGFELHDGIHRGYIRVFNNGDHPSSTGTWVVASIVMVRAITSRGSVQIVYG